MSNFRKECSMTREKCSITCEECSMTREECSMTREECSMTREECSNFCKNSRFYHDATLLALKIPLGMVLW